MNRVAIPDDPTVLDTTVLSNFATVDGVELLTGLSGICTVPEVRDELEFGKSNHPYLRAALEQLGSEIPVVRISETIRDREAAISDRLDPGEAQAFAVVDLANGRVLTDDGDARGFAKTQGSPSSAPSGYCSQRSTPAGSTRVRRTSG